MTVPREHHTLTGHYPGGFAAVLMSHLGSIEMQMAATEPEVLKGINQIIQAVEHVHAEGFVHMDVKVRTVHASLASLIISLMCLLWYTEVLVSCLCSCRQTFFLLVVMGNGGWKTLAQQYKFLNQS